MAKILISESDIEYMVLEGMHRVLEAIQHGTASGAGVWDPQDIFIDCGLDNDEIDAMIRRYPQIKWDGYSIVGKVSSTEFSGEDGPGNVSSLGNDKTFGGQYNKAIEDISLVTNPVLRNRLTKSLNDFCESLEPDSFEQGYPDPDERYDSMRDLGEDNRYVKEPMAIPQPREPRMSFSDSTRPHEYDEWLGHSDIPGSNGKFFHLSFFINNYGQIDYHCLGDSDQHPDQAPYEIKRGSWLDQQIRAYIKNHFGQLRLKLTKSI